MKKKEEEEFLTRSHSNRALKSAIWRHWLIPNGKAVGGSLIWMLRKISALEINEASINQFCRMYMLYLHLYNHSHSLIDLFAEVESWPFYSATTPNESDDCINQRTLIWFIGWTHGYSVADERFRIAYRRAVIAGEWITRNVAHYIRNQEDGRG